MIFVTYFLFTSLTSAAVAIYVEGNAGPQHYLNATMFMSTAFASSIALGPSTFTAPGAFPTSVYSYYYNSPTGTAAQAQPIVSDPVNVCPCFPTRHLREVDETREV